jgi:hypothetical protein
MRRRFSLAAGPLLAGALDGGLGFVAGVINDAHARQRRHRERGLAILLLIVLLLAGLNVGGAGIANNRLSGSPPPLAHAADAIPPVQIRYLEPCLGKSVWYAPCP